MSQVYSIRNWIVKRGRDEEFTAAWKTFAKWLISQRKLTGSLRLYRDELDPAHYVSIESWETASALKSVQADVQFGKQSFRLQQLTLDASSRSFTLEAEEGSIHIETGRSLVS